MLSKSFAVLADRSRPNYMNAKSSTLRFDISTLNRFSSFLVHLKEKIINVTIFKFQQKPITSF